MPAQDGILNFGKVNETLYRGAHLDSPGISTLKKLGIKSIIDLRMPGKAVRKEMADAQANGIICTNIPMSGVGKPRDEQVKLALAAIESLPGPVYVHCEHGCDRTGTIIACYRLKHDKWTNQAAMVEAERYGMSKLERGMRSYVLAFGN